MSPSPVAAANTVDGAFSPENSLNIVIPRNIQLADDIIKLILQSKEDGKKPHDEMPRGTPRQTYQLWQSWDQLEVKYGVLYCKYEDHHGKTQYL